MKSSEILDRLVGIANTPGKNDKESLLKECVKDADFVKVLEWTYNPFKTYGIQKMPTDISAGTEEFTDETWQFLHALFDRELTGNAATAELGAHLNRLNEASGVLLQRIIRKDLCAGFAKNTINKVVKGLIPVFPYMRCCLPKDAKLDAFEWGRGCFSQEKADGMFVNVLHDNTNVTVYGREGNLFPPEKIADLALEVKTRLPVGYQYHGELLVMKNNKELPRETGNGILNSIVTGNGDFAEDEKPVFKVWDRVPLEKAVAKGKYEEPYSKRLYGIATALLQKKAEEKYIFMIPTRIVYSEKQARAHFAELVSQGKEGTILKKRMAIWRDGTSKEQVKFKVEFEVDLVITALVAGEEGTRIEGRTGALACETSDGLLKVNVAVKNESMRDRLDAAPSEWIGKILAVRANAIMKPSESNEFHSLFLPRCVEDVYRTDKDVADSLDRVKKIFESAVSLQ